MKNYYPYLKNRLHLGPALRHARRECKRWSDKGDPSRRLVSEWTKELHPDNSDLHCSEPYLVILEESKALKPIPYILQSLSETYQTSPQKFYHLLGYDYEGQNWVTQDEQINNLVEKVLEKKELLTLSETQKSLLKTNLKQNIKNVIDNFLQTVSVIETKPVEVKLPESTA